MSDPKTGLAARLASERERLGLTVEQFAVLIGITAEQQRAIEGGTDRIPMHFHEAICRLGVDPEFILGQTDLPQGRLVSPPFGRDDFHDAVDLLRRSQQAVEAFVGEGAAKSCPQLVAATMNAAIQSRYAIGVGDLEDFTDKISAAIEGAGTAIASAISEATSSGDPL
jgi:transcriptional regulator with XRE-family HTH domain